MRTNYEILSEIRESKRLLEIVNEYFNQTEREMKDVRKKFGLSDRYFELIENRDVIWRNKLTIERRLSLLEEELRSFYERENRCSRSLSVAFYDDCKIDLTNGFIKGIKL